MPLFLLLLAVLAVKQLEFAVCQYNDKSIRLLHIRHQSNFTEIKHEPEYTFGDVKAYLSCNLTNSTGHNVGAGVINWFKNRTVLANSEHFIIMKNNTLRIHKPKRINAGVYMARHLIDSSNSIHHDCFVRYFAKPLVLDLARSVNIQEDESLDLKCEALGYPKPVVTWFRNGIIVTATENSSHVRLHDWKGIDNARLMITRAKRAESGMFKCQAFSAHFNYTSSKELVVRVKDKLAALWPLLGILGSVILLSTIIASQDSRDKARIRKQEAILYSESKKKECSSVTQSM